MQKKFSKRIRQQREAGSALIMVLMMSTILLLILTTGITWVLNSQKGTTETFKLKGQAANVAQAGLQDGVNWFKRQGSVKQSDFSANTCKDNAFAPTFNVNPELSATDNASVGLVRDYQVKGNIYGRYILKRQNCSAPEDPHAVRDITVIKGKKTLISPNDVYTDPGNGQTKLRGEGIVWALESEGILYERKDFSKTNNVFNTGPSDAPNRILGRATAAVEISQLALNTETTPLVLFGTAGAHNFNGRCRLVGGNAASAGVTWNGVNPNVTSAQFVPAGLTKKTNKVTPITTESVFSVTEAELRGMADNIYSAVAQVPERLKFSITFLDGNFSFNGTKPLQGGGLLYVNGDLNLADNGNSLFSGVIFVDGRLTVGKDNSLAGAIFARNITCQPGSGQGVLEYNANLISSVRQRLALYRENNLTHTAREF